MLVARAYDVAGNTGNSLAVTVRVAVAPVAAFTSPAPGTTFTGMATATADATDNTAVTRVEFYVDAALAFNDAAPPWSATFDSAGYGDGPHTLTARAYDAAGNFGTSPGVGVTTQNNIATYDPARKAPVCATVVASATGPLLNGRGTRRPEPNQPNTIANSCADGTSGSYHVDESNDRIRVATLDGSPLRLGKTVEVRATVWATRATRATG